MNPIITDIDDIDSLAQDAEWRTDPRLHRDFVDDRVVRTFFTIGALAAALGKEPVSIRRWLRLKILPEAYYRTDAIKGTLADARLRLWTEEQIVLIVVVAHECGIIGRRPRSMKNSKFEQTLKQRWAAQGWPL